VSKNYVKPSFVARELNVDLTTVQRWCREGKLDAFQTPGGHWKITLESVKRLKGVEDLDSVAVNMGEILNQVEMPVLASSVYSSESYSSADLVKDIVCSSTTFTKTEPQSSSSPTRWFSKGWEKTEDLDLESLKNLKDNLVKTEANLAGQWLDLDDFAVHEERGPQGIQGSCGPCGPQGVQGIQGIQGSCGPCGPTGLSEITTDFSKFRPKVNHVEPFSVRRFFPPCCSVTPFVSTTNKDE
jgi:excisionase family DNA binding protein